MSYTSGVNRFTGLSGLDTDGMVQKIMTAERAPLDKIQQNRTKLQWKQDAYREMTSLIRGFRDTYFDVLKKDTYMLSSTAYNKFSVSSSNEKVKVTAAPTAEIGQNSLEIKNLATISTATGEVVSNIDLDKKLADIGAQDIDGNIQFTINGSNGNTKTFNFVATNTLREVLTAVNNDADIKVQLSYSSFTERFTLKSKDTGSATGNEQISIADSKGTFFQKAALDSAVFTKAENAVFKYNGLVEDFTSKTNILSIDGVQYDVTSLTEAEVGTGLKVDVNIKSDPQASLDTIKKFVQGYNDMIEKLHSKINEKAYRKFPPLTDEQKKDMSEKDIELWEEKARSGLLSGDDLLKQVTNDMRNSFMPIAGVMTSSYGKKGIYDIGITTSKDFRDGGKLVIDEEKLKKILEEDPKMVEEILTQKDEGILVRFQKSVDAAITTKGDKGYLLNRAGIKGDRSELDNLIYKQLQDMEKRIGDFQDLLIRKENDLYLKFSRLETALANSNSQSAWFSQQIGG